MEFNVMPDDLFGAAVRVNGQWLGAVEERAVSFRMKETGEFLIVIELMPLRGDLTGEVYPLPFARTIRVKDGQIVLPETETDGHLHIRRAGRVHQLFYRYPKAEALGNPYETMPLPLQTETADFDHDGRLDAVETFFTNRSGHLRVRSATGQILLQDVYPDNGLRVEVIDLNRDGRPEVLIFWEESDGFEGEIKRMQLWEPIDGAISGFEGFTGIRRNGRGEALLERKRASEYREATDLYRYGRQIGESATFENVKREARTLKRATTPTETVEAWLASREMDDEEGALLYLAPGANRPEIERAAGKFYSSEIGKAEGIRVPVKVFRWIVPQYYDVQHALQAELVHLPDSVSEYKILRLLSN